MQIIASFYARLRREIVKTLKKILKIYEEASDQTINLSKSSFIVSRNVGDHRVEKFRKSFKTPITKELGYYLGMPSHNGKNKSVVFRRIKDGVWKVLQS